MPNLTETPQNPILGMMSKALRGGKDILNYPGKLPDSVPLLGGMGAGDLIFGKGDELMEDMSYGSPPYRGTGWATKVDPRTVDLAFAPGVGSLAGAALRGTKYVPKIAGQAITSEGRRDFFKKVGGLGAGAALSAATPELLVKALREAPALAAKEGVPTATAQVAKAVAHWTPEAISSYLPKIAEVIYGDAVTRITPEMGQALTKWLRTPEEAENVVKYLNLWDEYPQRLRHPNEAAVNIADEARFQEALKKHPSYDPSNSSMDLSKRFGLPIDEYFDLSYSTKTPNPTADAHFDNIGRLGLKFEPEQLDEIIKLGPHNFPKELAEQGFTPQQVTMARFPIRAGPSRRYPEDDLLGEFWKGSE
jgi:hypothetical protein